MKRMIAKKTFVSVADGSRGKGDVFMASEERAETLVKCGLAGAVQDEKAEAPESSEAVADEGEAQARTGKKAKS